MRKYGRTDDNQAQLVSALRKAGCNVLSLAAIGQGCGDLLVHRAGELYMLEIKDGSKYASQRKLTKHQEQFHKDWPVHVVKDIDEALRAVGL
jgi:Holliday junction resolvase